MARFNDVADNQHMIDIANAIRSVTRTEGKMTIPEMPERLWNIQVVMTRDVVCDFSTGTSVSLGTYDKNIKHLFIATPKTSEDVPLLAAVGAELALVYNEETGELSVSFASPSAYSSEVNIKVVDLLLSIDDNSAGFLVNQALGGGGSTRIEEYSNLKRYNVGDQFIYNASLGITVVAHEAEEFVYNHNRLMANQVYDLSSETYRDLVYFANLVMQKLDASAVKNEHSDSRNEVYSADYANKAFAPLALSLSYYASKTGDASALFQKEQPTVSAENKLVSVTTNTDYDWSAPDFVFRRVIETGVTVNKANVFRVSLPFKVSRDSNISWGAKIKVSTDSEVTWNYISSAQSYGAQSFDASVGNTIVFDVAFDLLPGLTKYEAGTMFEVEVFKKQASASSLTTTVYCGVLEDGAVINTLAEFVVANIAIDTAQIEDGAVTMEKLAPAVRTKVNAVDDKLDKVEETSTLAQVYSKNADGTQSMRGIENEVNEDSDNLITSGAVFDALSQVEVEIDNETIVKNDNGELEATGLKDSEDNLLTADDFAKDDEVVHNSTDEEVDGVKSFNDGIKADSIDTLDANDMNIKRNGTTKLKIKSSEVEVLGNLRLSGNITDGTNSISVADIADKDEVVPLPESTSSFNRVAHVASGQTTVSWQYSSNATIGNTYAIRTANGRLKAATPTEDDDLTPKAFVEDLFEDIQVVQRIVR